MIRLDGIRKEYDDVIAVRNLSITINKGDIFGLIGPNGAGKTTTMKIIVGLLEPTKGKVYINEKLANKNDASFRRMIGYIPDFFSLYDELKTWEYLDFFAESYRIPDKKNRIAEILTLTDLTAKENDFVSNLSRGMKQRLAIGKTLLHNPEILVLDEPAAGLDPKGRVELRDILKKLSAQGKTTIISSHILTELSDICNTVGIMQKGVLVESGKIDEIADRVQKKKILRLAVLGNRTDVVTFVKTCAGVEDVSLKEDLIEIVFTGTREQIPMLHKMLVEKGIQVVSLYEYRQNLEEIFMSLSIKEVS